MRSCRIIDKISHISEHFRRFFIPMRRKCVRMKDIPETQAIKTAEPVTMFRITSGEIALQGCFIPLGSP
jgi:hypothetical protein